MFNLYFKHSSRCPISLSAKKEVRAFLEYNKNEINFEEIDVINNKERSQEIGVIFNIEHESPQIFICNDTNDIIWHGSHWDITKKKIEEVINGV